MEFEMIVDGRGRIQVPPESLERLKKLKRGRVRFQVVDNGIPARLRRRGVTQKEVTEIAARQMEEEAQILRFLDVEGILRSDRTFRLRVRRTFQ